MKTDLEDTPRPPAGTDDKLIHDHSHNEGENQQKESKSLIKKNKGGRPKGSKSKTTLLSEAIANDFTRLARSNSRKVFKTLADKAIEGEPWAVKLFMDKVVPNAQPVVETGMRDYGIQIVINDMKSPQIEGRVIEEDADT